MSRINGPTPPTCEDVLLAAAALDWPALLRGSVAVPAGEESWRLRVTSETAAAIWAALGGDDDDDDDALEHPSGQQRRL
jgi:hypothetical protein